MLKGFFCCVCAVVDKEMRTIKRQREFVFTQASKHQKGATMVPEMLMMMDTLLSTHHKQQQQQSTR